jgi:hypothetical protein
MQFSAILVALVASKAVYAQSAYAAANANVNVDVDAVAIANAAGAPTYAAPTYPVITPPPYVPTTADYDDDTCFTTYTHPDVTTITDLTISSYCPVCDYARDNGDVYTTTYETAYVSVCPTGLTTVTYTVVSLTIYAEIIRS